jgi:uncharacterized protein (TIGR00369 family)
MSDTSDPGALIARIPYCRHLGILARIEDGRVLLTMPFAQHLVGNPVIPALHGGVVGSLLETAAIAQIVWELGVSRWPKPVDISIDYLRTGRAVDTHANARIARQGRRVINVLAALWQEDEMRPVAALRGHFLLPRPAP